MSIDLLLSKTEQYLPPGKADLIRRAYDFAAQAHHGQRRESGEPYLEHPLQTAMIIAGLEMDADAVASALLHDVPEDCGVPIEQIEKHFGRDVSLLVDGVTKLGRVSLPEVEGRRRRADEDRAQAENLRKMLVAMAEDTRVVLIKLADRLHNMRTLRALSPQRRRRVARETMEIYAPLAGRLGIWQLKGELEDLAFRYLNPREYARTLKLAASREEERQVLVNQVCGVLRRELATNGIQAEVNGRAKTLYSIYQKLRRYQEEAKDFSDIYDLAAVRILVSDVTQCYSALGVVHGLWRPIPGQFDDYIANPKESRYQSLHTTVMWEGTQPLEIQIRTHDMHQVAEYGIATHWRYKEGARRDIHLEERIAWLRQLLEWQRDLAGAEQFVESVKTDFFQDQVFVYTPKGDIRDLPAGSTPLDFAYRIHTDLGHRCIGAKVNGKLEPLNHKLANGDVVEVLAGRGERGPSRDWLNPDLGYLLTSHAKEKVRQWFRRRERAENVDVGRTMLEKELRRLGIPLAEQENIARLFKFDRTEELYAAIGYGDVTTHQIAGRLSQQRVDGAARSTELLPPPAETATGIKVLGVGDMLTHLARCCNPLPGDEIIGYVTRNRGVNVHRQDCPNMLNEDEKERFIAVAWGASGAIYPVAVRIEAWDRVGLIKDISTVVSEDKVNMAALSTTEHSDRTATILVTLQTTGLTQLSRLMARLEAVRGVTNVSRVIEGVRPADTRGRRGDAAVSPRAEAS